MKRVIYQIILFLFILENLFLAWLFVRADLSNNLPQQIDEHDFRRFDLCAYLQKNTILPDKLEANFPYDAYLNLVRFPPVEEIKSNLKCLDTFFKDSSMNREVLLFALTHKLASRTEFKTYNPDSLLMIIQWAEKFESYARLDISNNTDIFYSSIYDSWMNFAATELRKRSQTKPSLKYDFTYKYLIARCNEKNYSIAITIPKSEKVIWNLTEKGLTHLFQASWYQSSWKLKAVIFTFTIVTIFGFISIISKIIKYINIRHYQRHE